MTHNSLQDDLVSRLDSISLPLAAVEDGNSNLSVQSLESGILSKFLEWLSQNSGLIPEKESVLNLLSNAIDLAFTQLNKPVLASILKPFVKAEILRIAGNLYDSLFTPSTQV